VREREKEGEVTDLHREKLTLLLLVKLSFIAFKTNQLLAVKWRIKIFSVFLNEL
jgi:hypothetical protein